jgi:APA family basic amino acid/polyamine antiporter
VPCLGLFVNVFMMSSRSSVTYYAFLIWFTLGMAVYLLYGAAHSKLRATELH